MLAPRQHHLDPDDRGRALPERPWWRTRVDWPTGVHFEDVSRAELALERLTESRMPPPPVHPGAFGCSASMAVESRFAELENPVAVTAARQLNPPSAP